MQKLRTLSQVIFIFLVARLIFGWGDSDFEKWCPFGGIETLYLFFGFDTFSCSLGSSNLYMALAVILLTLLTRRSFCGWVCPIGTISEWSGKLHLLLLPRGKPVAPPEGLDFWLRKIKYVLLVVILGFTFHERELIFRAFDPFYALCSKHGEDITGWAYVVLGGVVFTSLLLKLPFCRYLCPLAAVLNPFSLLGFMRLHRNKAICTDCGICDRVCPHGIAVSRQPEVTNARCIQCFVCSSACPKPGALELRTPGSQANEEGEK